LLDGKKNKIVSLSDDVFNVGIMILSFIFGIAEQSIMRKDFYSYYETVKLSDGSMKKELKSSSFVQRYEKAKEAKEQEICKIFATLNNEMQTKTEQFDPSEVLEELIKINSHCLIMNIKDHIPIDEALHRMQDLTFSLYGTEDKERNPITLTYKLAGRSEWKLPTERA
jgi:hypothetical protein